MMSRANCTARLSHHNPWIFGNLGDLERGGNSGGGKYAGNLLLIFKFQLLFPLLFEEGVQFIPF